MTKYLLPMLLLACAEEKSSGADTAVAETPAATDPCSAGDNPTLVVGQGELGFEAIEAAGEQAELIHGPQGGYHTNIGISATGLDASHHWTVELEGWIGSELVGHTFPIAKLRCNRAEGALQAWSLLLIWTAEPEDVHGQMADIIVTTKDSIGTPISAEQSLLIWDPSLE
jgi:hypothetical protein